LSVETIKQYSDSDLDGFIANLLAQYRERNLESVALYYRTEDGTPKLFLWSLDPVLVSGQLELMRHGFIAGVLDECLIDDTGD